MTTTFAQATITVSEMKAQLEHLNDDDILCAASQSGDYWRTVRAIALGRADTAYLVEDCNSPSGFSLKANEFRYDDDDYNYPSNGEIDPEDKIARPRVICLNIDTV